MTEAPLMTPAEAAHFLNVPTETLRTWRYRRNGPRYHKLGNLVRYRLADIEAWLTSQIGA